MGNTLRLRNCTRFELKFWRKSSRERDFLAPGKEGVCTWSGTYSLCAECSENPRTTKNTRHGVNGYQGIYYAVYSGGKIQIVSERQILAKTCNEDNPYIGNWLKNEDHKLVKELPPSEIKWCCIHQETNQSQTTEQDVVIEWKKGGCLKASDFMRYVQQVKWSVASTRNNPNEGYMSQEEVYSQNKRVETFRLKPGQTFSAWQAFVEVTVKGRKLAIFLPRYETKDNMSTPPEISGHCEVSIIENTCR